MSDDYDGMNGEDLAEERTDLAAERTEVAEDRTEWARERTEAAANRSVLANERTFSAWLRTGMSAIAVGLGIAELLPEAEPRIAATAIGLILIVLGAGMCVLGARRYYRVAHELTERELDLTPNWIVTTIVGSLAAVSILAIVLVLIH